MPDKEMDPSRTRASGSRSEIKSRSSATTLDDLLSDKGVLIPAPPNSVEEGPDDLARAEVQAAEAAAQRLANRNTAQDIQLRREFAQKIPRLFRDCLFFVAVMIFLSRVRLGGAIPEAVAEYVEVQVNLSDTVIKWLLGALVVKAIGLYVIVAQYVFPKPK